MFDKISRQLNRILSRILAPRRLFEILNLNFARSPQFSFNDKKLDYYYHSFNNHRLTERSIEIPIIRYFLEKLSHDDTVLEIGNVTNHYYTLFSEVFNNKTVVDKYEKGYGVINEDLIHYVPQMKFDFIFSISTFEHFDSDRGRNPDYVEGKSEFKTYAADGIIHTFTNLLADGGKFVFTGPIGYASEFDETINGDEIYNKSNANYKSLQTYYLKKINDIEWVQVSASEVEDVTINTPFKGVNAIVVIIMTK